MECPPIERCAVGHGRMEAVAGSIVHSNEVASSMSAA